MFSTRRPVLLGILAGLLTLMVAIWMATAQTHLAILHSDEYVWYRILSFMHDAFTGRRTVTLLVANQVYGWPFWLAAFSGTLPFWGSVAGDEAGVLIGARAVTALFAAANTTLLIFIVGHELRRRGLRSEWNLAAAAMIWIMPSWWVLASMIHPQHMLLFFELLGIAFLLLDAGALSRYFWFSIAAFGFGLGVKLEAIIAWPILCLYLLQSARNRELRFGRVAALMAISTISTVAIWAVTNTYVLTPKGMAAWLSVARYLVVGRLGHENSLRLLSPVADNYLCAPVLLVLVVCLLLDAAQSFRKREFSVSFFVGPVAALVLGVAYLWGAQQPAQLWMFPIVLALFGLIPIFKFSGRFPWMRFVAVILICTTQIAMNGTRLTELFVSRWQNLVYSNGLLEWKKETALEAFALVQAQELGDLVQAAHRPMISPYTDFDFRALGIDYLERYYGCFGRAHLMPTGGRVSLPPVDLVIFRRNDPGLSGCKETRELVSDWNSGNGEFRLAAQTQFLLAYGRVGNLEENKLQK